MLNYLFILLIIFFVLFVYWIYRKNFKIFKVPSVCLITGGVKTMKTGLSVCLSQKDYISRHRKWWILTHIFRKDLEEPLYYCNCYVNFGFLHKKLNKNIVSISLDHLNRNVRFNYKSVIYIQECSLLADNMDYNNVKRNVDLSLYHKLIAHETRGGAYYIDTQSVLDAHYSIKRVCSTYLFIMKNVNFWLFRVLYVREMINTENGVNNFDDDIEFTMRKLIIFRWWYKHYDCYEYSYLTDNLSKDNKIPRFKSGLVSFNPLYIERSDKRKKEGVFND